MLKNNKIDLANDSIFSLFKKYFFPMLMTMLIMSTYSTVDGIFVNKCLGDEAVAAITIVWPLFPFVGAIAFLFGLGASSLISFYIAKGKGHVARMIFSSVIYLVFSITFILGFVLYFNAHEIISFFVHNLSDNVKNMSIQYLKGIFLLFFSLFMHPMLDIFVINDKRPKLAMIAMLLGSSINIVLNYTFLFILDFGIIGSAYATVIGHFIGTFVLLWHYISKKGDLYFIKVFKIKYVLQAMKYGFPHAISEIGASYQMWLYNANLKQAGGDVALSIYGAMAYAGFIFFTILLALSQSLQPMTSFNFGLKRFDRLKEILKFYIIAMIIVTLILYALFFIFSKEVVAMFLNDKNLQETSANYMKIYYIGHIFVGFNLLFALFLQSMQRVFSSLAITICYTFLFVSIFLHPLSVTFGLSGAFFSYPITQFLAFIIAILVLMYEFKKGIFSKNAKIK